MSSSSGQQSRHGGERTADNSRMISESIARSDAAMSHHRRNDGQSTEASAHRWPTTLTRSESWVEIASQPSSSSLSSIGDEIVTTGLRVGAGASSYPPRRRRLHQPHVPPSYIVSQSAAQAGTSSQEEYDETESEEDRLMTSSTENMQSGPGLPRQQTAVGAAADSDSDDDDENATALGRPSQSPVFRPQPNAFSHPPNHLSQRSHSTSSAIPHHPPYGRPSMSQRSQTRVHRNQPNFMSPSYQADNDAALRASLTTLLSCAAAARGLPKSKEDAISGPSSNPITGTGVGPSSQPMELCLVPESELMAEGPVRGSTPAKTPPRVSHQSRTASNSSAPSGPASASSRDDKSKRAAAAQSKPARATKKKKTATAVDGETATFLSPTLLTWVVSAGVVVLVSVVGFGAGYVIGREVGRQEAGLGMSGSAAGAGANATSCGRDLVKSTSGGTLRRFRWTTAMGRSVAA